MNIGILGAGRMGRTLARLLIDAGHQVRLANSRGPESLKTLVAELGPGSGAGTREEIVAFADVVVLATPWEQTPAAVQGLGPWNGKIVVDTTNNRFGPGPNDLYDLGGRTSSEVVAELVPGARVVKAFNHQPIPALAESLGSSPSERNALFIAGDDADAMRLVAQLIRDIGGEPIATGNLRDGGLLQGTGRPLAGHGRLLTPSEARRLLGEVSTTKRDGI
jgi:8-hydroxy-5-deazaflavin:NADPH oxidoreductase